MKALYTALEPGNPETDFWYYNAPATFHTWRAFSLFDAAERAGLLRWETANQAAVDLADAEPVFVLRRNPAGPLQNNTYLAYWCACASTFLGLDRGPTETTNWKPFEDLFGLAAKTLSRAAGPLDLDRDSEGRPIRDSNGWPLAREQYAKDTTAFFNAFVSAASADTQPPADPAQLDTSTPKE